MKAFLDKLRWFFAGYRAPLYIPVLCFFVCFVLLFFATSGIDEKSKLLSPVYWYAIHCLIIVATSLSISAASVICGISGIMGTKLLYSVCWFPRVLWEEVENTLGGDLAILPWYTSVYLTFLYLGVGFLLFVLIILFVEPFILIKQARDHR